MRTSSLRIRFTFVLPMLATLSSLATAQPSPGKLPTGGVVATGQAAIVQQGNQMTVNQASQSAILNWQSFNIGADAGVTFSQPNASAVALNRVLGQDPSAIYGSLNANGQVFLVNPNGVLFAPGAQVDVGGLVASSLDIANGDFLNSTYRFNRNGATGSVINAGNVAADYVSLLAPEVLNEGVIAARMVALAGGESVALNLSGNQLIDIAVDQASIDTLVENRQLVKADNGQVIMSAQSANGLLGRVINSGAIEANGLVNDGGVVRLVASDSIQLGGSISADAGANGNGGSILAIADLDNPNSTAQVSGTLSAQGGSNTSNGGFIETSASNIQIADSASISTLASNGLTGNWLIDPTDFYVAVNGGDMTGTTLSTQLASNNVTVQTTSGGSGTAGNLYINDAVSWSSNNLLTLNAQHDIIINAPITASGGAGAGVALEFGQEKAMADFPPSDAQVFIRAPINLSSAASFSTKFLSDGIVFNYSVITNAVGLANVSGDLASNYVLGSDITLAGEWTPLGTGGNSFDGIFDGLGHTVSGLTITNTTNPSYVGLFGYIGAPGFVQNIGVVNANVAGGDIVGALAGQNDGLILTSYSTGSVTGSDVVGADNDYGVQAIGGLVGANNGNISHSYSNANVTATTGDQSFGSGFAGGIGGFVGMNFAAIDNSYATGNVNGLQDVGGFAGYSFGSITTAYSTGTVAGATNVGGFLGWFDGFTPGLLDDTYWNVTTSGVVSSADDGLNSSTGLTTAEAVQAANWGFFDFSDDWVIREGTSLPMLRTFLPPLYIGAQDESHDYDGSPFAGGYTAGFSSGLDASDPLLAGTLSFGGAAINATDAGPYAITPAGLSLADNTNQQGYLNVDFVDGTLTINPALVLIDVTATLQGSVTRVYDGTTVATLNPGNFLLTGFLNGDGATVTETVGTFASANVNANPLVGQSVSVTLDLSDYTAVGSTNLANYSLTTGTINGDIGFITPRPLTLSGTGLTVDSRVYNGTTAATFSGSTSPTFNGSGCATAGQACALDLGNLGIDTSGITAVYDSKNVLGTNNVTLTGFALTGTAASNYSVTGASAVIDGTGTITPKDVSFAGWGITPRQYDGTTEVALELVTGLPAVELHETGCGTLADAMGCAVDNLTLDAPDFSAVAMNYNDKDVLDANSVTITGVTLGGDDAGNYNLLPVTASATMLPKEIAVALIDNPSTISKEYDGTTAADAADLVALLNSDGTTWGFVAGELALTPFTTAYAGTDVGTTGITASYSGWVAQNASTLLSNYDLPTEQTFQVAGITPKAISISGQIGVDRVYNATTAVEVSGGTLAGVLSGDVVEAGIGTGAVASANVGQNLLVTVEAGQLTGADAANYQLTGFSTDATVNITPAPLTLNVANYERIYNGAADTLISGVLEGLYGPDNGLVFVLPGTGTLSGKNVDTYTGVVGDLTLMPTLSGTAAGNYELTAFSGLDSFTTTITPKTISVQGLTAAARQYNGTMSASLGGTLTLLSGVSAGQGTDNDRRPIANDDVAASLGSLTGTFAAANVGTNIAVTLSGNLSGSGNDADNYVLVTDPFTGSITQATLAIKANDINTRTGAFNGFKGTEFSIVGGALFGSDSISSVSLSSDGASRDAAVGTYLINASNAQGTGLTNYAIGYQSGSLDIRKATLEDAVTAISRAFMTAISSGNIQFEDFDTFKAEQPFVAKMYSLYAVVQFVTWGAISDSQFENSLNSVLLAELVKPEAERASFMQGMAPNRFMFALLGTNLAKLCSTCDMSGVSSWFEDSVNTGQAFSTDFSD